MALGAAVHAQDESFPMPRPSQEPTRQSLPGPRRFREPSAQGPPSAGQWCLCGLKGRPGSTSASGAPHLRSGARRGQGGLPLRLPPPPPQWAPRSPAARPPCGSARSGGGGPRARAGRPRAGRGGAGETHWPASGSGGSAGARKASGLWQKERIKLRWQLKEGNGWKLH